MEYYNIDDILAGEQRLKVTFNCSIHNFGFYMSGSTGIIRKGAPVSMPSFLLLFLLKNNHCTLIDSQVELNRDTFEADPSTVDLSNAYFFRVMSQLEDTAWLARMFYLRIEAYIGIVTKESLAEEDLMCLSSEEKQFIVKSRKTFREYQKFLFRKSIL